MATITLNPIKTFISGETVDPTKLNQLAQSNVALTAGTIVDADVSASAAIALSKLATGALPAAITVASANLVNGTIVDADINGTAAIAGSKLADAGITAAKLNGAQTGAAPIYGVRAWAKFAGQASNGACVVAANGNVTSVSRISQGTYEVVMAAALPDANYAIVSTSTSAISRIDAFTETTTTFRLEFLTAAAAVSDPTEASFMVIR